jgi:hypothetical protein
VTEGQGQDVLLEATEKICLKCNRVLPLSSFWKHPTGKFGRHSHCIECKQAYIAVWREQNRERQREIRKNRYHAMSADERAAKRQSQRENYQQNSWRWRRDRMLKKYGLTMDGYELLLRAQGGRCAICGKEPEAADKGCLHVDHCHTTGVVRGLLCTSCNNGLGRFRDDPNVLARAIAYLTETR